MSDRKEIYEKLSKVDVLDYIEFGGKDKKLRFISWGRAWELLVKEYPDATYEVVKAEDGLPYFSRNDVHFVFTKVTIGGNTLEMWLPIQDDEFNPVKNPNSSQVNKAIMRCLVKNIAMFGLGISLYIEGKDDLRGLTSDSLAPAEVERIYKELISRGKSRDEVAAMKPENWSKEQYNQFIKALG